MLSPKHKGRGKWVVMDGDREVAAPFADKAAAEDYITAHEGKGEPEALTPAAQSAATALRSAKQAEFLSSREYQKTLGRDAVETREAALTEILAVFTRHFGEDAAGRATPELRQLCADPKREARRRLRFREIQKHGIREPATAAA